MSYDNGASNMTLTQILSDFKSAYIFWARISGSLDCS